MLVIVSINSRIIIVKEHPKNGANEVFIDGKMVGISGYTLAQHYGHCNADITDPDEEVISSLIVDQLNAA